jgi:hypothetical protein
MENSSTDRVSNEEVLHTVKEDKEYPTHNKQKEG